MFKFNLPDHLKKRNKALQNLAELSYTQDNLSLAKNLLGIARMLRRQLTEAGNAYVNSFECPTYTTTFCWDVLPDMAFRLGLTDRRLFLPNERRSPDITGINGIDYRRSVTLCTINAGLRSLAYSSESETPTPAAICEREACNGNIIEIALNRIFPAIEFRDTSHFTYDFANNILEVSTYRHQSNANIRPSLFWSPNMMLKPEEKTYDTTLLS